LSYPSGHAAYSMVATCVVVLYLVGKQRIFFLPGSFARGAATVLLFMAPIYIALTRTQDNRHYFSDINAGMCLGLFCGSFCYFLNYPLLTGSNSGVPKVTGPLS